MKLNSSEIENSNISTTASRYYLKEGARNPALDSLVELASYICQTEIAAISILENDRQWFKAKVGMELSETPIDQAFCTHTVLSESLLVEDALLDNRFNTNKLVTSEPFIRFYAGAPIITDDGHPLGTICVIDTVPKNLDEYQLNALKKLAFLAKQIIESKRVSHLLNNTFENVKTLSSLIPICFRCKSIKNDLGDWELLESFVSREFQAHLTHGVCERCSSLL